MKGLSVDRSRLKLGLAVILFVALAASAGALLAFSGKALFLVERGGSAAPIENVIVEVNADEPGRLTWLPDAADVTRELDDGTRAKLVDAYLRAWRQIEIVLATCTATGLTTYFAPGPAAQLEALVAEAQASGCRTRRSDGAHRLQLTFVSEDGGLAAFSDLDHWYVDRLPGADESTRFVESGASHDVVMRLDDGNWRIAAWSQTSREGREGLPERARPPAGFVASVAGALQVQGRPWNPDGVNYYPAATPWRDFWARYDGAAVDADLTRAATLGFDALRIFVPFGGPERTGDDVLDKLGDLLGRAEGHDLRVLVTLFDLDVDYRPAAWLAADHYLEQLLVRFRDEPAILAWDLKNEADLDDARVGRSLVDAWLRHVSRTARSLDPNHLLTVGWSDTTSAPRLADYLDVVSVHDYRDPASLGDRLAAAGRAVPGLPVLLTEYGASSWESPLVMGGRGELGQARDIAVAREVMDTPAMPAHAGRFLWALSDFTLQAPAPDGVRPWRRGVQRSFGVLTADGEAKASAAALLGRPLPAGDILPGPFVLAMMLALLLGALRAAYRTRRGRGSRGQTALLVLLHPLCYGVVGLLLTVLAETLRLPQASLPGLAVVGLLFASILAGRLVAIGGSAAARLRRVLHLGPSSTARSPIVSGPVDIEG